MNLALMKKLKNKQQRQLKYKNHQCIFETNVIKYNMMCEHRMLLWFSISNFHTAYKIAQVLLYRIAKLV